MSLQVGKRLHEEQTRAALALEEVQFERAKTNRLMAALEKCQSACGLEAGAQREQMKAHAMIARAEVCSRPVLVCVCFCWLV